MTINEIKQHNCAHEPTAGTKAYPGSTATCCKCGAVIIAENKLPGTKKRQSKKERRAEKQTRSNQVPEINGVASSLREQFPEPVQDAETVLHLSADLTYIAGIVERGEKRKLDKKEPITKAILEYVKKLEARPEPVKIEGVRELASKCIDDLYSCGRVWEAWRVGTMSKDDFALASEDDDMVDNVERLITDFIQNRETNKWIPVTERLPEIGVPVLVSDGKPFPYPNSLTPSKRWNFGSDIKITHWQPLPEAAK